MTTAKRKPFSVGILHPVAGGEPEIDVRAEFASFKAAKSFYLKLQNQLSGYVSMAVLIDEGRSQVLQPNSYGVFDGYKN